MSVRCAGLPDREGRGAFVYIVPSETPGGQIIGRGAARGAVDRSSGGGGGRAGVLESGSADRQGSGSANGAGPGIGDGVEAQVPAETVVPPENELLPVRARMPTPALVNAKAPLIGPDMVSVVPAG